MRVALASGLFAALASSLASIDTVGLDKTWNVKVLPSAVGVEALGLPPSVRSFPVTRGDERTYRCYVAPTEDPAGTRAAQPAPAASRAQQARFQLERHPTRLCVLKSLDFWSYELCVGEHVRQFHKEVVGSTDEGTAAREATTHEHKIGVYAERSESVTTGPTGSLLLHQVYAMGTGGRSTTVTYDCDGGSALKGAASTIAYEIVAVTEPEPLAYAVRVAVRDPALCALLPSPSRILAPLNHTCFEHVEGWWTYEICLGGSVRQYHNDGGAALQDTAIGTYDWRHGTGLALNAVGTSSALVQRYGGGSACDVRKGRPREAMLRFECVPSSSAGAGSSSSSGRGVGAPITVSLLSITESPTCEYTVTFGTALACEHPDAVPALSTTGAPATRPVYCVPEAEEGEEEEDVGEDPPPRAEERREGEGQGAPPAGPLSEAPARHDEQVQQVVMDADGRVEPTREGGDGGQ